MARDIPNPMLHAEAVRIFEEEMMPLLKAMYEPDGVPDWPMRCETWNNWTDGLCKSHLISDWQYKNWSHPPSCGD